MNTRKQKMISLYQEDQDRLKALAEAAMMTESEVIRAMLKIVKPTEENGKLIRIAKKLDQEEVDELRIMAVKKSEKKIPETNTEGITGTSQEECKALDYSTMHLTELIYVFDLDQVMTKGELLKVILDPKFNKEDATYLYNHYINPKNLLKDN